MRPGLEDILPLTPLQEGLLFHGLYAPECEDVYVSQVALVLAGAVDAGALHAATVTLLACHSALRTGFRHEDVSAPVQIVLREVTPRWQEHDLRGTTETGQAAAVERVLAADRERRFDLAAPPLLRFTVPPTAAADRRS